MKITLTQEQLKELRPFQIEKLKESGLSQEQAEDIVNKIGQFATKDLYKQFTGKDA